MSNHFVSKLYFPTSGSSRQQVAAALHKLGWIAFWIQFVLIFISVMILLFAVVDPNFNLNLKSGLSLFSVTGGIATLGLSIYWFFRYTGLSKQLRAADPALHPSRGKTIQVLQIGMFINLVSMLLTLLGLELIIGALFAKTLSFPEGAAIYRAGQLIEPLDIFVVQANVNLIVAQFVGVGISAYLLSQVEHHQDN